MKVTECYYVEDVIEAFDKEIRLYKNRLEGSSEQMFDDITHTIRVLLYMKARIQELEIKEL